MTEYPASAPGSLDHTAPPTARDRSAAPRVKRPLVEYVAGHLVAVAAGRWGAERAARIAWIGELEDQLARTGLDRPLALMHIPKTAGSALVVGFREMLPRTPYVGGYDRSMFGAFDAFETLDAEVRSVIHLEGLPPAEGADLVAGHFAYSTLAKARPGARFMTVLREPRSRLLSLWMHWRATWQERQPFAEFLDYPQAGYQTDNIALRMLLWPHPQIPDAGFIDAAFDQRLGDEALARLESFDFSDTVENPSLERNVRDWLVRPFAQPRVNETARMPPALRGSLGDELTAEALARLDQRSRLDRLLWLAVVRKRMPEADTAALADDTFRKTVARHAELMSADPD